MSAWRRFALELFPEHKHSIEDKHLTSSIYQLFFDLLPIARDAHHSQDKESLGRIYKFAEWCWRQRRAPNIQNAVAVAFYEHLVDDRVSLQDIPDWLKPSIFDEVKGLFEQRLSPEEYQKLLSHYNAVNKTNFR